MDDEQTIRETDGSYTLVAGDQRTTIPAGATDAEVLAAERAFFPSQSLQNRQDAAWAKAKAYRETRKSAGCQTPFAGMVDGAGRTSSGIVQTGEDDRPNLLGVTVGAVVAMIMPTAFPDGYTAKFTMADNSEPVLNAQQAIVLGLTALKYISACHGAGSTIRAAIYASDEPEAVDITAGYP